MLVYTSRRDQGIEFASAFGELRRFGDGRSLASRDANDPSRKWGVHRSIIAMLILFGGTPRPRDHQANRPMARLSVPALDNPGYLARASTRREARTRGINVLV
jgi:hypothetical protein